MLAKQDTVKVSDLNLGDSDDEKVRTVMFCKFGKAVTEDLVLYC